MVQLPRTEISIAPSDRFEIVGSEAETVKSAVEHWCAYHAAQPDSVLAGRRCPDELAFQIELFSCPPRHQGLGTGTQIAFATALALNCALDWVTASPGEFAAMLKRGKRSAIGSYGFFQGGFLVDRGKRAHEILSPLDFRTDFSPSWPVLIILDRENSASKVFGIEETAAFATLPPTPVETRTSMVNLVNDQMVPGLLQGNYNTFSEAVYEFGKRSGLFFTSLQCGAYHSEPVAELVAYIRGTTTRAVGQSSWGPGIFAISETKEESNKLIELIRNRYGNRFEMIPTFADNAGVRVTYSLV